MILAKTQWCLRPSRAGFASVTSCMDIYRMYPKQLRVGRAVNAPPACEMELTESAPTIARCQILMAIAVRYMKDTPTPRPIIVLGASRARDPTDEVRTR